MEVSQFLEIAPLPSPLPARASRREGVKAPPKIFAKNARTFVVNDFLIRFMALTTRRHFLQDLYAMRDRANDKA
jgi:hypothetical protein